MKNIILTISLLAFSSAAFAAPTERCESAETSMTIYLATHTEELMKWMSENGTSETAPNGFIEKNIELAFACELKTTADFENKYGELFPKAMMLKMMLK